MGLNQREKRTYANIISDGSIRVKTDESDPRAVRRDYEIPSTGQKGTKYELKYDDLSGYITRLEFYEGDYGKVLHIFVNDGSGEIVLSVNMQTNYADDIMKRLPAVNFKEEVLLNPFSFTDKNGKVRRGISVSQNGEKIKSFFHDQEGNSQYGFPQPEKKPAEMDKDDWKRFFLDVKKFLQDYIENNVKPQLEQDPPQVPTQNAEAPTEQDVPTASGEPAAEQAPEQQTSQQEQGAPSEDDIDVENIPF